MEATSILVKPIMTEKSTWAAGRHNLYTFEVHPDANKIQIKQAVESIYKVGVADVRTINRKGKTRRTRFGMAKKSDKKRALVVLKGEERIELF
jgi:large subunit ribosomal protein L23